jgi:hypothetical protein
MKKGDNFMLNAQNITREQLIKLLITKLKASLSDDEPTVYNDLAIIENNPLTICKIQTIAKDLQKVKFDFENITCKPWCKEDIYVGIHTLKNKLTFLGMLAGGGWEIPVFFILYYDGKNIRAYIPSEGNTYNNITDEAFGNDQGMDEIYAQDQGYKDFFDYLRNGTQDWSKIEQDLLKNTEVFDKDINNSLLITAFTAYKKIHT